MYKVPKGEEDLIHIKLVRGPKFDPETGEENKGEVMKTNVKQWEITKDHYPRLGIKTEILHDPRVKAAPKRAAKKANVEANDE